MKTIVKPKTSTAKLTCDTDKESSAGSSNNRSNRDSGYLSPIMHPKPAIMPKPTAIPKPKFTSPVHACSDLRDGGTSKKQTSVTKVTIQQTVGKDDRSTSLKSVPNNVCLPSNSSGISSIPARPPRNHRISRSSSTPLTSSRSSLLDASLPLNTNSALRLKSCSLERGVLSSNSSVPAIVRQKSLSLNNFSSSRTSSCLPPTPLTESSQGSSRFSFISSCNRRSFLALQQMENSKAEFAERLKNTTSGIRVTTVPSARPVRSLQVKATSSKHQKPVPPVKPVVFPPDLVLSTRAKTQPCHQDISLLPTPSASKAEVVLRRKPGAIEVKSLTSKPTEKPMPPPRRRSAVLKSPVTELPPESVSFNNSSVPIKRRSTYSGSEFMFPPPDVKEISKEFPIYAVVRKGRKIAVEHTVELCLQTSAVSTSIVESNVSIESQNNESHKRVPPWKPPDNAIPSTHTSLSGDALMEKKSNAKIEEKLNDWEQRHVFGDTIGGEREKKQESEETERRNNEGVNEKGTNFIVPLNDEVWNAHTKTDENEVKARVLNETEAMRIDFPVQSLHFKDSSLHEDKNSSAQPVSDDNTESNCRPKLTKVVPGELVFEKLEASDLQTPGQNNESGDASRSAQMVRRHSWSVSNKESSPAPSEMSVAESCNSERTRNGLHHKKSRRKQRCASLWYDEETSLSGVLADEENSATNSDGVTRSGSVGPDSDKEGFAQMRRKLRALFGSIGKGGKKMVCTSAEKSPTSVAPRHNAMKKKGSKSKLHEVVADSSESDVGNGKILNQHSLTSAQQMEYADVDSDAERERSESVVELPSQLQKSAVHGKAYLTAEELVSSEAEFLDRLRLLNVDFRNAVAGASCANRGSGVLPDSEMDRLLSYIPQLQKLSADLLCDLEQRLKNWGSNPQIADVLVAKGPFLKLFSAYIKDFQVQSEYLDELCSKYPPFHKVLLEFEASDRCKKLAVSHYMLKPVQRLPQYRLLLQDYLEHLIPSNPDYNSALKALKIVNEAAEHANTTLRDGDNFQCLLRLQGRLSRYELVRPGRCLIKEGELLKLCRKDLQPRYFVLLSDALLYTSYVTSAPTCSLKLNVELPLVGMRVNVPFQEEYRNEFSVFSVARSFTLAASSEQERAEWLTALNGAIEDIVRKRSTFATGRMSQKGIPQSASGTFHLGKEAPVWIPDARVTMCQMCTTEFTLMFRRHHCRGCGKVVCGLCSANEAPLEYKKFQVARVCDECFVELQREVENYENNGRKTGDLGDEGVDNEAAIPVEDIKFRFRKKEFSSGRNPKGKKYVPPRLKEVSANDAGSQMSGYLQIRDRKSWRRLWFVLKDKVLFEYGASEDVRAINGTPVLGYDIEVYPSHYQLYEGVDAACVFHLTHPGQGPLIFCADNSVLAGRWVDALKSATVL